jgi:hypothetical protein
MIPGGRSVADRPRLRIAREDDLPPASPRAPLYIAMSVVWGWAVAVGLAWVAYGVCRLTGIAS